MQNTTPIIVRNSLTCLEAAKLFMSTTDISLGELVESGAIKFEYGWTVQEVADRVRQLSRENN
jgi:hypothetical protein